LLLDQINVNKVIATMIITNLEGNFDDIFDITGDDISEHFIEDDIENFLDSRLDVDSVLIDDIKLEHEANGNIYSEQSPPHYDYFQTEIKQENVKVESDEEGSLSPQQRDRCNTWPRILLERPNNGESWNSPQASLPHQHPQAHHPPPLACVSEESEVVTSSNDATTGLVDISHDIGGHSDLSHDIGGHNDLSSSAGGSVYGRRNPWGNQSYADLITQAISSSPDKRMTLSQIYDWMVGNVPYFTERQSNSKSAGWKNSIRHNLSLHQKFVKIPNEGAGKSSWWTLNLENSQSRKPRRRATSGDIKMMAVRRERVRSRTESFKHPDKLSRSYSSSGLPPLSTISPSGGSYDGANSAFSSFRSRNLSTTSTTSQDSCGLTMEDLVTSELGGGMWSDEASNDPGNFSMNSLDMSNQSSLSLQHQLDVEAGQQKQKLKILEPRDCPLTSGSKNHPNNDVNYSSSLSESRSLTMMKMYDEERRQMIVQQLEILNQRKMAENADVDQSIMLLEEQLQIMIKRSHEEEMIIKEEDLKSLTTSPALSHDFYPSVNSTDFDI